LAPVASVWGIVVAAGAGSRFGGAKQFAQLGSGRVVDWAVVATAGVCEGVVLVLPPDVAWDGVAVAATVPGGATRAESVRAGLAAVPADALIIVVHDAARPLAPPGLFLAVIAAVAAGADGALPGVPVTDTLKQTDGDRVVATVPRGDLVAAQTPQAFRADVLRRAHAGVADATDDAALVEAVGGKVVVVPGAQANMKLTTASDLALAAALLEWAAKS
jgi:2-C-methyl-D-erythritol 4-phosphate cytidylyltransferase